MDVSKKSRRGLRWIILLICLGIVHLRNHYHVTKILDTTPKVAKKPIWLTQSYGFALDQEAQTAPVAVVSATSSNHLKESFIMFSSLIEVGYRGPLVLYLMHRPNERKYSSRFSPLVEKLKNSKQLNVKVFELEEPEEFATFCFKPRVVSHFMSLYGKKLSTFMWADTSVVFKESPDIFTQRVIQNNIAISTTVGALGMYENTDPRTYQYLNISRTKYIDKIEIQATAWVMNLKAPGVVKEILEPWIECGVVACRKCMAPPNTIKDIPFLTFHKGPGATKYIVHRQDQSVLSLLEYEFLDRKRGTISLYDKKYLNVSLERDKKGKLHHIT